MPLHHPTVAGVHRREQLLAGLGAAIGITLTVAICSLWPHAPAALPLIVAPLGASAVLIFVVPASPLAQPWPVVGGNVISTLLGVAVFRLVPDVAIAAGVAVGVAIAVMVLLRCLHPPGGAAALTAVIGGAGVHAGGFAFALVPVGLNSVVLVALGIAFHRLVRRSYPHIAAAMPAAPEQPSTLRLADIDAALADLHESFDIAREDLDALLTRAQYHADRRPINAHDRGDARQQSG